MQFQPPDWFCIFLLLVSSWVSEFAAATSKSHDTEDCDSKETATNETPIQTSYTARRRSIRKTRFRQVLKIVSRGCFCLKFQYIKMVLNELVYQP